MTKNDDHENITTSSIKQSNFYFGKMKDTITINGELLEPIDIEWEVNISKDIYEINNQK